MEERLEENIDNEKKERREKRMDEMRRKKEQQKLIRKWVRTVVPVAAGILILAAVIIKSHGGKEAAAETDKGLGTAEENMAEIKEEESVPDADEEENPVAAEEEKTFPAEEEEAEKNQESGQEGADYAVEETEDTLQLGEEIVSGYAILIDIDSRSILAEKNAYVRMNPASMTKVLTLLVAAEHIDNLNDTFTITQEITDYCFVNECSNAGFEKDETVTIEDLLYGTILPSGAEAAVGLATYVSGSQEAFVELMNEKLEALGLSGSAHFTNCVGIYDENHYCTAYDMAVIMEAAVDNELCRKVLSSRTYTTSETEEHPEGMILSNWFLRRIEDKDVGGKVAGGKTGYVSQSKSCAVSYGIDKNGKKYICVTASAGSPWLCIGDHVKLYQQVMM